MTFESAKTIARQVAAHYSKPFVVWRMPAWPTDVYGVIDPEKMPVQGVVAEKVEPRVQGSLF
jgi:hypothetical protein